MDIAAEIHLSPTLSLLADLIGSFANPNPEDDSEPHGPGTPVVRSGTLAEVRHATISMLAWAQHLGNETATHQAINEGKTMKQMESTYASSESAPDSTKSKPSPGKDPSPNDNGDPHTDGVKGKQPPTVAMEIIEPAIKRFVHELPGDCAVQLPVAAGAGSNPWKLSIDSGRTRTLALLVAGAQFQFAAEATRLGRLRALFQWGASELIKQGLRRLGHDPRAGLAGTF
jgi:hypothetical protein